MSTKSVDPKTGRTTPALPNIGGAPDRKVPSKGGSDRREGGFCLAATSQHLVKRMN